MVKIPTISEIFQDPFFKSNIHAVSGFPILAMPFGSRLYGTSTPESDLDLKVLVIPYMESLFRRDPDHQIIRIRNGEVIKKGKGDSSEPGDIEVEYISIYRWLQDLFIGQTYALEMAMYIVLDAEKASQFHPAFSEVLPRITEYVLSKVPSSRVGSMAGFADKQVWDYVRRGQAYKDYTKLKSIMTGVGDDFKGFNVGQFVNGNSVRQEALKELSILKIREDHIEVRDRIFFHKANLGDLLAHVNSSIETFGPRSIRASDKDIDWNSLAHAYRCYWQALEFMKHRRFDPTLKAEIRDNFMAIKTAKIGVDAAAGMVADLGDQVRAFRATLPEDIVMKLRGPSKGSDLSEEDRRKAEVWVARIDGYILGRCVDMALWGVGVRTDKDLLLNLG